MGCCNRVTLPSLQALKIVLSAQFIPGTTDSVLVSMMILGLVFMLMTFAVFIVYGLLSGSFSDYIVKSKKASAVMQRIFATSFSALGLKLAFSDQV
ncbi:putative threonine efflux protein, RhtB family [Reinekea forsetii]|uniref:Putative threonine efflux protein, RhtB family n=1 Tax=Reinekea forsetii TaxID=1336806 RepID=A0A2K8KX29_9GAMM|nr:putative threonine efflux protein, RhtB family [Reinekea forsetii]